MKRFIIALVTALLIAAIGFAPVAAAAPAAKTASTACGDTYVVQPLDYLAKIASYCGTTVANILALNPGIVNPNIIYPGQVLKLTGTPAPGPTPIPITGTYVVQYGDTLFKISVRYGTTVAAIMAVNPQIYSAHWIYAGQVINLPTGSYVPPQPPPYNPPPYYPPSYTGQVTLSTYRASAGDTVTVYVTGFPAGADIDYRLGENGQAYSVAYDAVTDSSGSDDKVVTIPASANEGEYWIVRVTTTGMKNGMDRYSALIYIDN